MHKITMVLYDCKPLKARLTKAACIVIHGKKRGLKFNNDQDGLPFAYKECSEYSGVAGAGEAVTVKAASPAHDKELVITIDGSFQYVR